MLDVADGAAGRSAGFGVHLQARPALLCPGISYGGASGGVSHRVLPGTFRGTTGRRPVNPANPNDSGGKETTDETLGISLNSPRTASAGVTIKSFSYKNHTSGRLRGALPGGSDR